MGSIRNRYGYTQEDVQELARILTGVGVNFQAEGPKLSSGAQADYIRAGLFEFNPNRHDHSLKHFLGHTIEGSDGMKWEYGTLRLTRAARGRHGALAEPLHRHNTFPLREACVPSVGALGQVDDPRSTAGIALLGNDGYNIPSARLTDGFIHHRPSSFVLSLRAA